MKPKKFFFILLGLCLVLTIVLGGGFYMGIKKIRTQTGALARTAADATLAQEHLDQLSDLKKQFQELQPALAKLNVALPTDKNQSEVVLQIQQLAANAGMKLPSASFQANNGLPTSTSQTVRSGDVLALPINFQLSGSYDQLQAFLASVENLGRYSNVSALSITRADNNKGLTFSITLNVYVKP
ncbi:MAG TPA: type 4a pilus biogenesis protein PilO [Candidatus Saccharimonadales bacterium]|nr:type 4a pilus biogenesis protein PilO [Candidatus Saccharimonadales bacterium]